MKVSVSSVVLVLGDILTLFFLSSNIFISVPYYPEKCDNANYENICFQLSKSRNMLCYPDNAVSILPDYFSGKESPALSETSQNIEIQFSYSAQAENAPNPHV